jgi:hypothetical protein
VGINRPLRYLGSLAPVAALAALVLPSAVTAAGTVGPLPASNYRVQAACGAPLPLHASCLAEQLVPVTSAARAHTRPIGIVRSAATPAARSPAAG